MLFASEDVLEVEEWDLLISWSGVETRSALVLEPEILVSQVDSSTPSMRKDDWADEFPEFKDVDDCA